MAIHSFRFAISIYEKQMVWRESRRYWTVVKGKLTSLSNEIYTTTHSSKYEDRTDHIVQVVRVQYIR